jgi:hypothetical protein
MVIARQLVDGSVFRATWTLRRRETPVANSVPDTQPLTPDHHKFFNCSAVRSSIFAAPDVRPTEQRECVAATPTSTVVWRESGEFESQTGFARPEAGSRVRRHDPALISADDRALKIRIV